MFTQYAVHRFLITNATSSLVRVLEVSLQWPPAMLVILFLYLLARLETPLRYSDHERTIEISK